MARELGALPSLKRIMNNVVEKIKEPASPQAPTT